MLVNDVELVSDEQILEMFAEIRPSIIVGGPPCQGFSVCRHKGAGDPSDPRNSLFEEFVRLGRLLSPSLMVMENVPNLLKAVTAAGEPVVEIICKELQGIGYHTYFDVLQAIDFGVPQMRKRLFVIASRTPLRKPFPDRPTHTPRSNDPSFRG